MTAVALDVKTPPPYVVVRQGRFSGGVRFESLDDAVKDIAGRIGGRPVEEALADGSYGVESVPRDRWSEGEQRHYRNTARQCLTSHDHGSDRSELARTNCGACVLGGYEPRGGWGDGRTRADGPNYAGWARIYVEAGFAIPRLWEAAFERERHGDNDRYSAALELSIATFGLHWGA